MIERGSRHSCFHPTTLDSSRSEKQKEKDLENGDKLPGKEARPRDEGSAPDDCSASLNSLAIIGEYTRTEYEDVPFSRGFSLFHFRIKRWSEPRHGNRNGVASALNSSEVAARTERGTRLGAGFADSHKVIGGRARSPAKIRNEHYVGGADLVWFGDSQPVISLNRWFERTTLEQEFLILAYRQTAEAGLSVC